MMNKDFNIFLNYSKPISCSAISALVYIFSACWKLCAGEHNGIILLVISSQWWLLCLVWTCCEQLVGWASILTTLQFVLISHFLCVDQLFIIPNIFKYFFVTLRKSLSQLLGTHLPICARVFRITKRTGYYFAKLLILIIELVLNL